LLIFIFICFALLLNSFGCAPSSVVNENTGTQSSKDSESQSTEKDPTDTSPEEEKDPTDTSPEEEMDPKAIWQDPNNVVLLWSSSINYEYRIYRSNNSKKDFEYIGKSITGSYRDATAKYPNEYYYKIKAKNLKTQQVVEFDPICAVVTPDAVDSVSVIMYHNFVSEEDVKNGIEFEEYSISPYDFEQDLIWLKENGYVTITSAELLYFLENKEPIPKKAVILSIDDGSWGVYTNAWPLLKKYGMKADFNVIGDQIDATWELLHAGGSRENNPAPFCTWEELIEMQKSGEINICSHTYGLHKYNKKKRVGMSMMENESPVEFAQVVKKDYNLALSCIEGWLGTMTDTVAYPYSKRSAIGDQIVLENTGYKILMAGEGARGTAGNYFVRGCDFSNQFTLMSRPCRMNGTPISVYLERIQKKDASNGVNSPVQAS
jgi:peptidoglycan/xylan/chitin deacetylase (PgdA/CDA1 family)